MKNLYFLCSLTLATLTLTSSPALAEKKDLPAKVRANEPAATDLIEIHDCKITAKGINVMSGRVCGSKKRDNSRFYTQAEIPLDKVIYRRFSQSELSFYCKDEACIKQQYYNANNGDLLCEKKTNTYFDDFSAQNIIQFKKDFAKEQEKCQPNLSHTPHGSTLKEVQMLEHKEVWKANCENGKFAILAPLYWGGEYCGGYGDDFLCADTPEQAGKQLCQKL